MKKAIIHKNRHLLTTMENQSSNSQIGFTHLDEQICDLDCLTISFISNDDNDFHHCTIIFVFNLTMQTYDHAAKADNVCLKRSIRDLNRQRYHLYNEKDVITNNILVKFFRIVFFVFCSSSLFWLLSLIISVRYVLLWPMLLSVYIRAVCINIYIYTWIWIYQWILIEWVYMRCNRSFESARWCTMTIH